MTPSVAKDISEIEGSPFDSDLISKPVDLCMINRLDQQLMQVDTQPCMAKDVFPRHKHLSVKRSQRCRQCEHNLSKPEYNPASIKFKIQLAAHYHIPDIKIFRLPSQVTSTQPNEEIQFILKLVILLRLHSQRER